MRTTSAAANAPPCPSGDNPFTQTTTYKIEGKTFIVESVFKENAKETLGAILLRLMQSDKTA